MTPRSNHLRTILRRSIKWASAAIATSAIACAIASIWLTLSWGNRLWNPVELHAGCIPIRDDPMVDVFLQDLSDECLRCLALLDAETDEEYAQAAVGGIPPTLQEAREHCLQQLDDLRYRLHIKRTDAGFSVGDMIGKPSERRFSLLLIAVPAAAIALIAWRIDARITSRPRRGRCLACAYDRRGIPPATPCPECGLTNPPTHSSPRATGTP